LDIPNFVAIRKISRDLGLYFVGLPNLPTLREMARLLHVDING
jgi:hypothetical protein